MENYSLPVYEGITFDSNNAANFAKWCDRWSILWDYKPQNLIINGISHKPDFWLPEGHIAVELHLAAVKPGRQIIWNSTTLLKSLPKFEIANWPDLAKLKIEYDKAKDEHKTKHLIIRKQEAPDAPVRLWCDVCEKINAEYSKEYKATKAIFKANLQDVKLWCGTMTRLGFALYQVYNHTEMGTGAWVISPDIAWCKKCKKPVTGREETEEYYCPFCRKTMKSSRRFVGGFALGLTYEMEPEANCPIIPDPKDKKPEIDHD